MNTKALDKLIDVVERTVGAYEQVTCKQFLMVLYAIQTGGMTQKELANRVGVDQGTVSRNLKILGPEGTGCLYKDGNLVKPSEKVVSALTGILQDF